MWLRQWEKYEWVRKLKLLTNLYYKNVKRERIMKLARNGFPFPGRRRVTFYFGNILVYINLYCLYFIYDIWYDTKWNMQSKEKTKNFTSNTWDAVKERRKKNKQLVEWERCNCRYIWQLQHFSLCFDVVSFFGEILFVHKW